MLLIDNGPLAGHQRIGAGKDAQEARLWCASHKMLVLIGSRSGSSWSLSRGSSVAGPQAISCQ